MTRIQLLGVAMCAAFAALVFYVFNPTLPFTGDPELQAVFQSSNGLRDGSPVRIAGVNVGSVTTIEKGPGTTTLVTMELSQKGWPVHADATAAIRARVFLEGGFMVELEPGSPGAPRLGAGATLPLTQTTIPVQFHQALTVFDAPTRESLRTGLDAMAYGLDGGGAAGLRRLAPEIEPLLRESAITAQALQGTEPDDAARLIASTARVAGQLDSPRLGDLVDNLAATTGALNERDEELAATITEVRDLLRVTPAAMLAVDAALPGTERAARAVRPALRVAPGVFRETTAVVRGIGRLASPARRARTIAGLETALRDLPGLIGNLAVTFPPTKPLTDCLSSHILPLLEAKVPDGALSTGRPVWQDFAHGLVGLAGASQNFDGNGHDLRYQLGLGDQSLSTTNVGGLGTLYANAPSTVRSRPLPRADRKPPPLDASHSCSSQPQPRLATPDGPGGLRAVKP
jgi:virulence factor Mce-like protein